MNRIYLCIDLKSFYASVECVARELDPLTTNLVVADKERTDKTICLAVTPSLKAYGISGRARLFEVVQRVEEINRYRRSKAPGRKLDGESYDDPELKRNPSLALSYIVAPPRMSYYMETSARIYDVYKTEFWLPTCPPCLVMNTKVVPVSLHFPVRYGSSMVNGSPLV